MFFSKSMVIKILVMGLIIVAGWSLWKRIDAIIDNYQKYYDIALVQKIWQQESERFDNKWGIGSNLKENEIDKKWDKYQKNSPFPAENKPVPQVADEYTSSYYRGLWNFFIRSGFASIFFLCIIIGLCGFSIRFVWRKITEATIEKLISKL